MDFPKKFKGLSKNIFKEIDYKGVMDMFADLKSGIVIMGNIKDKYTCAILEILNKTAIKRNVDTIYFYDGSYENKLGSKEDVRSCLTLESKMDYYSLVEKIGFKSDTLVKDTLIPKIEYPLIFGIKYGAITGILNPRYAKWMHQVFIPGEKEDMTIDLVSELIDLIQKTDVSEDHLIK
jgi:hypothetical protein